MEKNKFGTGMSLTPYQIENTRSQSNSKARLNIDEANANQRETNLSRNQITATHASSSMKTESRKNIVKKVNTIEFPTSMPTTKVTTSVVNKTASLHSSTNQSPPLGLF